MGSPGGVHLHAQFVLATFTIKSCAKINLNLIGLNEEKLCQSTTLPKSNILDILYIRADFNALGDCLKLINSNLRNEEGGRILHCDGGLKFCAQLVFLN